MRRVSSPCCPWPGSRSRCTWQPSLLTHEGGGDKLFGKINYIKGTVAWDFLLWFYSSIDSTKQVFTVGLHSAQWAISQKDLRSRISRQIRISFRNCFRSRIRGSVGYFWWNHFKTKNLTLLSLYDNLRRKGHMSSHRMTLKTHRFWGEPWSMVKDKRVWLLPSNMSCYYTPMEIFD